MIYLNTFFTLLLVITIPVRAMQQDSNDQISDDEILSYDEDNERYMNMETIRRLAKAQQYIRIGLGTCCVLALVSIGVTPIVTENIYDNTAAIVFNVGWPFVVGMMPFLGLSTWQIIQACRHEIELEKENRENSEIIDI